MKIDTRIKLILLLLVNISVLGLKNLILGSLCFSGVCLLTLLMGQKKKLVKYVILYFVTALISYGCLYLPAGLMSILSVFALFIRVMIPVILFADVFLETTKVSELISAMYLLKMPRGLVITLSMTIRFFPTLKEELHQIYSAMRLRGMELSFKNLFTRPGEMFEAVIIPVIMRSVTIAEELSASAVSRGLDNPGPRSSFIEHKIKPSDVVILIVTVLWGIGLFAVKYRLYGRI